MLQLSWLRDKNALWCVIQVKFWPKNAQILKSDFEKPQKSGNFPLP